jgi:hypothetical protein
MHKVFSAILLLTACLSTIGCGGGAKVIPTGTVTGEVKTMNGQVFDGVTVVFYPAKGPTVAVKADPTGKFNATVSLGDARVAVVPKAVATTTDTSPSAIAPSKEKPLINPKFSSPESSGLTVKVEKTQKEKVVLIVE